MECEAFSHFKEKQISIDEFGKEKVVWISKKERCNKEAKRTLFFGKVKTEYCQKHYTIVLERLLREELIDKTQYTVKKKEVVKNRITGEKKTIMVEKKKWLLNGITVPNWVKIPLKDLIKFLKKYPAYQKAKKGKKPLKFHGKVMSMGSNNERRR